MSDRLDRHVDALDRAWRSAEATPAPSTIDPDLTMADAYTIQEKLIARRLGPDMRRAGWKLGLTSGRAASAPIVGTLLDSMVVATGARLALSPLVAPQVEAELVIVMGEDIDTGVSVEDLKQGPHQVAPGIEVIDYRTVGSDGPIDWVADNATVAFAVVGDPAPVAEPALAGVEAVLSRDGDPVASGHGRLVMGDPLAAVAWLSEHLAGRGHGLRRGDVILTGSLTGHHGVEPSRPSTFEATFGGLGSVQVTFEP